MTSRQAGQKIGRMYANRTGYRTGRQKAAMPAAQKRRLAQFLICGTIFVLLVAAKLLIPARLQWLSSRMDGALEHSMDVTEVFSAAGRLFSGEGGGGWKDLYQSVFHPEESAAVPAAGNAAGSIPAEPETGAEDAQPADPDDSPAAVNAQDAAPAQSGEQSAETKQLSYILYSNQTLPEHVSMEQRVLGFDYCTPLKGTLTSGFGYREHPVEGCEKFHYGLDIAAEEGTAVACFADGTVTAAGESSSYGKYLVVLHDGGFSTLYAHCSRLCAASGSAVKKGEKLAEVGSTGEATGSHLHFELQDGGTYLDPIYYVSPA